jgi:hypothetical protein
MDAKDRKGKTFPICENQRHLRIISLLSSLATDHFSRHGP